MFTRKSGEACLFRNLPQPGGAGARDARGRAADAGAREGAQARGRGAHSAGARRGRAGAGAGVPRSECTNVENTLKITKTPLNTRYSTKTPLNTLYSTKTSLNTKRP